MRPEDRYAHHPRMPVTRKRFLIGNARVYAGSVRSPYGHRFSVSSIFVVGWHARVPQYTHQKYFFDGLSGRNLTCDGYIDTHSLGTTYLLMTESPHSRHRILFVHYNVHSTGSARQRIVTLVTHFAQSHPVLMLLPEPGPLAELLSEAGIAIEYRSFHDNNGHLRYLLDTLDFARFCRSRSIALIHILDHVWWRPAELVAAKILGIPFISMVTFNRPADAKAGGIRWARKIIANSESSAKDFIDEGLGAKTQVIHNAISMQPYIHARSIRRQLYPTQVELLIGFVGVLHPVKGIDVLLTAFAQLVERLDSVALVLVGPEKEPGYQQVLQELVQRLGIEQYLQFHGFREDIPQVMKSIDLLVVPSREEPFGFVTIEAGATATPVIASAVGGIPEIIRHGKDGLLVPPDNAYLLADAIEILANDPLQRRAMGKRFQARVAEHFSEERMLQEWEQVYTELLPTRK